MVYSAIETTCFGLYWPSSDFYNIEEESINAVKLCGGCWLRNLYINPLTTLFLVQELFVKMEKVFLSSLHAAHGFNILLFVFTWSIYHHKEFLYWNIQDSHHVFSLCSRPIPFAVPQVYFHRLFLTVAKMSMIWLQ